ncbi:MAG: hypothetical protein ACSLE8_12740 [Rhodococcus sp. (in: high G+C Gram-positive bacteria)]
MVVDFPALKSELNDWLAAVSRAQLRSASLLGMFPRHIQHEGENFTYSTVDGSLRSMDYTKIEESITTTAADIAAMSRHDLVKLTLSVMESVATQATQASFDAINREVEAVGNTVRTADPTGPDALLAVLVKIQIDFDDTRDRPQLPTMVCHPSRVAELQARWDSLTADQKLEFEQRREAILDRKYEEYVSRENNRTLVD